MSISRFVLADPGLCIGCETCMAACLLKHLKPGDIGEPRLHLVKTLSVSAPVACHHCEDAPCVRSCPVHALYHESDGRVAVRKGRCIGCYSCVMACPFGAIDIAGTQRVDPIADMRTDRVSPFPLKCDLCYDRPEGPCCVQACPNDGLKLVDGNYREKLSETKRYKAASAEGSVSSIALNPMLA